MIAAKLWLKLNAVCRRFDCLALSCLFGIREPALLFLIVTNNSGLDCQQAVDGRSNRLKTFLAKCYIRSWKDTRQRNKQLSASVRAADNPTRRLPQGLFDLWMSDKLEWCASRGVNISLSAVAIRFSAVRATIRWSCWVVRQGPWID